MGADSMAYGDDFTSSAPPRKPSGGVYQVAGLPVEFPFKPYGTQLAFMGRVIATLDKARRQGRAHGLLESPTGTGKSLSLLCSALAWQRHYPLRSPATAPPVVDPFLNGGGFVVDDAQKQSPPAKKKKNVPTIYYSTRTHAQITQVVREYRRTSYRVPMAILASRKHYCINKNVCNSNNIDEQCKMLLDDKYQGCPEFKNAQKLSRHPSLQIGGCYEVHDIEDLLRVGRKVKGCPYFAAQTMAEAAQLVFCPYNYIISPIVRRAMDIDLSGSIIILDEAHNIEDTARDSGSVDVDEESLHLLQTELASLATDVAVKATYQPLHDAIEGLAGWIADHKDNLKIGEFEYPASFWTGEKALEELKRAGISPMYFPLLQESAVKAVKDASDTESDGVHLSGAAAMTLESLFSSLNYFFIGNGRHMHDYQLVLQRFDQREGNSITSVNGWRCVMSLWCLKPAVVFQDIADLALSVILTSGTLSPMGSFASELGVQFEAPFEAPHVINVNSQVFATVLSSGPTTHRLNASYKTANVESFQDELGVSLEEICRIVPGGALVFFPSYKLLDKLKRRWSFTGQWARLNAQKIFFTEPRGSTEELEPELKGYYNAILGKAPLKKGRGGTKQIIKNRVPKNSSQEAVKGGAAFLAVCRGKVSEGIDFSDDNARVVVIVGIPFPNINDVQVKLKKRYNDAYKSSKNLLSGNEWYCHQAFRALNQAAGRCIRHKFDYGGIIFIDERYQEDRNLVYISKWLKNSIKDYGSFQNTMVELEKFFKNAEEQIKSKSDDMSPKDRLLPDVLSTHVDKRKLPWPEPNFSNQSVLQSNQNMKSQCHSKKFLNNNGVAGVDHEKLDTLCTSSEAWDISSKSSVLAKKQSSPIPKGLPTSCQPLPSYKKQYNLEGEADTGSNYGVSVNLIDLEECDSNPRYAKLTILNPLEERFQRPILVEETSEEAPIASPSNHSEGNTSAEMKIDGDRIVDMSGTLSTTNRNLSCVSTLETTPERSANKSGHLKHESLMNNSVNSHFQKKRRLSSPTSCCTYTEHSASPTPSKPFFSDYDVDLASGDLKRPDELCCKSMKLSRCGNVKLERHNNLAEFSSKKFTQERFHISCRKCKRTLGQQKDGFLVSCSSSSSSKFYLAHLLIHGLSTAGFPQGVFSASPGKIQVMVCDTSSLNQKILEKFTCEGSSQHSGVWAEKDGCVFKAVACPFCPCENSSMALGAQILATDASNVPLLNKVLLFSERLDVRPEPSNEQVMRKNTGAVNSMSPPPVIAQKKLPPVIDIDSFAYKPQKKVPVPLNTRRSKLRLPSTSKSTIGS